MTVRELAKECQLRITIQECKECPFKQECEKAQQLYMDSCPASYEKLLEAKL